MGLSDKIDSLSAVQAKFHLPGPFCQPLAAMLSSL